MRRKRKQEEETRRLVGEGRVEKEGKKRECRQEAASRLCRQLPTDLSSGTCRSGAMPFYAFLSSSRRFVEGENYCRRCFIPELHPHLPRLLKLLTDFYDAMPSGGNGTSSFNIGQ